MWSVAAEEQARTMRIAAAAREMLELCGGTEPLNREFWGRRLDDTAELCGAEDAARPSADPCCLFAEHTEPHAWLVRGKHMSQRRAILARVGTA